MGTETTRERSGKLCPGGCGRKCLVTEYKTKRGRVGDRRYEHTTCGDRACRKKVTGKRRALKYLESA